ncbi:MAG: phosphatase PAP2 family protein [Paracoccaceae bacterium]
MTTSNARFYILLTLIYGVVSVLFVLGFNPEPMVAIQGMMASIPNGLAVFLSLTRWSIPVLAVVLVIALRRRLVFGLAEVISVIIFNFAFGMLFISFKATMPFAVSFYADPYFVNLDLFIHRTDPFRPAYEWFSWIPVGVMKFIYTDIWFLPTFFLPVWLMIFDGDSNRVRRYMILHAAVWIVLGSVLALIFMSAGPVYYDVIYGGTRFAELARLLANHGIPDSAIGFTQQLLLESYQSGTLTTTSGISAFPSVHVGMATVVCIYLAERFRFLAIPSAIAVAFYQLLSVQLGWHYAVDGYFSIFFVGGLWYVLKRRTNPKNSQSVAT